MGVALKAMALPTACHLTAPSVSNCGLIAKMARKMLIDGELGKSNEEPHYDFDLFVIGAGSGGVHASRFSTQYRAKVGICELPFHPISSEVIGGVGGTLAFLLYLSFALQERANSLMWTQLSIVGNSQLKYVYRSRKRKRGRKENGCGVGWGDTYESNQGSSGRVRTSYELQA